CLRDLSRLRAVIRAAKSRIQIPLTIKIRTGWDQQTRNSHEVVKIAAEEGVTWVAIHGRTRAAAYSGQSDWDYIREVKASSPVPVLGNGDITSSALAQRRLNESGCDGVMLGRGCLKNPFIFQQARSDSAKALAGRELGTALTKLYGHLCGFYDERL